MPATRAECCHAYWSALDALRAGKDHATALHAAIRAIVPTGEPSVQDMWDARLEFDKALRDYRASTVATSPYLNRRLRSLAEVEAELRKAS